MEILGLDAERAAQELGAGGVDNMVTNAERICAYEERRIALTNEGVIVGLEAQYGILADDERQLEERVRFAPPVGDLKRLRRRAVYYWSLTALLIVSGFAFALLSFAPFRLGWKAWLYCGGIAALTPFLVEKLLAGVRTDKMAKALTAVAAAAGLASLMLLAAIRGNLLAQTIRQNDAPAVVIDDAAPAQPAPENTFYDATLSLLRIALLLLAFSMEAGAGLALNEAWRTVSDSSEDWDKLRAQLAEIRHSMAETAQQATMLRNEPAIFAARFWRDFYRGLLTNAVRGAMAKLLFVFAAILITSTHMHAEDRLDLVIAIDLTQSVAVPTPEGKSEFQKNVEGVLRLLGEVPAGTRITVFGITDHSFANPDILLSARVPDDPGYFGERLDTARRQLEVAWEKRITRISSGYARTDIFGALFLANQLFAAHAVADKKTLVLFSDMREDSPTLNLESMPTVLAYTVLAPHCGPLPDLHGIQVGVLGADGAGRSIAYWQSLHRFWQQFFALAGADLAAYSAMRELSLSEPAMTGQK